MDTNGKLVKSGKIAAIAEIAIEHKDFCINKISSINDQVAVFFEYALGTRSGIAINLFDKIAILKSKIFLLCLGRIGMSPLINYVTKNSNYIADSSNNEKK